jgi:hypothetical protein
VPLDTRAHLVADVIVLERGHAAPGIDVDKLLQ